MNLASRMQSVGKAVAAELPKGTGFFVLAFNFNDNMIPAQYVANGNREDVIKAMKEFIDRNQMPKPENN